MRDSAILVALGVVSGLSLWSPGCLDERRPARSSTCASDEDCPDGLCYHTLCLNPAGDEDLDGLTNESEVALATDPFDPDTDGDGLPDGGEVGQPQTPADTDGDGALDVHECNSCDDDCDGNSDHEDWEDDPHPCDDQSACTTDECDPGSGCQNDPITCDDQRPCTTDSCHPDSGCHYELTADNLVQAGDGSTYIGWFLVTGGWGTTLGCEVSPEPHSGGAFLFVGQDICDDQAQPLDAAQIDQTISLPGLPEGPTGERLLEVSAWAGANSPDTTAIILARLVDAANEPVGEAIRLEVTAEAWVHTSWVGAIPSTAVTLHLSLRAERPEPGPLYAPFDDLTVRTRLCDDAERTPREE